VTVPPEPQAQPPLPVEPVPQLAARARYTPQESHSSTLRKLPLPLCICFSWPCLISLLLCLSLATILALPVGQMQ